MPAARVMLTLTEREEISGGLAEAYCIRKSAFRSAGIHRPSPATSPVTVTEGLAERDQRGHRRDRIVREFFPKGIPITAEPAYLAMVAAEITEAF